MFERRITPIYFNTGRSWIKVIQLDNTLRLAHIKEQLRRSKSDQYFRIRRAIHVKGVKNIIDFLYIHSSHTFQRHYVPVQFGSTERWNFLKTEQDFDSKRRQHY